MNGAADGAPWPPPGTVRFATVADLAGLYAVWGPDRLLTWMAAKRAQARRLGAPPAAQHDMARVAQRVAQWPKQRPLAAAVRCIARFDALGRRWY